MSVAVLFVRLRHLIGRLADEWRYPAVAEPTPQATGLALLGWVSVLVAALDITLTAVLRADFGWIAVPVNVGVTVGLAPTFVLLRARPVWRWVVYGMVLGLFMAWLLLLAALS